MSAKEETRGMDGERGRALVEAAREGIERAYAPYSEYRVGAALLTADDSIVTGVNVENASYPVGLCAERAALAAAVAAGCTEIEAMAIKADGPVTPLLEMDPAVAGTGLPGLLVYR